MRKKWLNPYLGGKVTKLLKQHGFRKGPGLVSSKLRPGGVASRVAGWQNLPKRTLTKADNFLLLW